MKDYLSVFCLLNDSHNIQHTCSRSTNSTDVKRNGYQENPTSPAQHNFQAIRSFFASRFVTTAFKFAQVMYGTESKVHVTLLFLLLSLHEFSGYENQTDASN